MSKSLSYFKAVTFLLVTFRIKNIVSFCVKKLLHFVFKSCYNLRQKLLHFGLMLHFASKVVTFCGVTVPPHCYYLQVILGIISIMNGSIANLSSW